MNKLAEKIIGKIRSPKVLIIAGLCGILLIFLSSFSGEKEKQQETSSGEFSIEEYRNELEETIEKMVINITGSRKVEVAITLEGGMSYYYADTREETSKKNEEDTSTSLDSELKEGYIIVKTADGGEEALLVNAKMPEVRGVAIVCEGGDNEILNQKIQNSVMAALNITSKRVYICGRKQ